MSDLLEPKCEKCDNGMHPHCQAAGCTWAVCKNCQVTVDLRRINEE